MRFSMDIIQLVKGGRGHIEWGWVLSEARGHRLAIAVFRDAMKFDGVPGMRYSRIPYDWSTTYDGVRLPANAQELQNIADLMSCMLLTPKVVDLIWKEAGETGVRIEPVIRVKGSIVATSDVHAVHTAVEAAIAAVGGDRGGSAVIESVGKYWVLSNKTAPGKAVNYGWSTKAKGNGPGVTGKSNVWQTVGSAHNDQHLDPSQVVRLMYRFGKLQRAGSDVWEDVDLGVIAQDVELSILLSHEGVLHNTRQPGVALPEEPLDTIVYELPPARWI